MSKITITVECEDAEDARSVIDQLTGRSDAVTTSKASETTQEKTEAPVEQVKSDNTNPDDAVVDSIGMPHNEDYHASSRAVNADGTWKARRGKTKQAREATAAFKAAGGGVEAPDVGEDAPAGLPGTKADDATGLPGAAAIPPAKPVTMAEFTAKATAVLKSGKISNDEIIELYQEVTGQTDTNEAVKMFQTNESMRRAAVEELTEIENG